MRQIGFEVISRYFLWLVEDDPSEQIYRGHSSIKWTLTPSAYRDGADGIKNSGDLHNWAVVAATVIDPIPSSNIELLVLAQHFGIPTPLLDWTTNPLTALFFACLDNSGNEDSCVVVANRSEFRGLMTDRFSSPFADYIIEPRLIESGLMNARTKSQNSVMTIHSKMFATLSMEGRRTFVLNKEERGWVRHNLESIGFTHGRIYGDINAVAQAYHSILKERASEERAFYAQQYEKQHPENAQS